MSRGMPWVRGPGEDLDPYRVPEVPELEQPKPPKVCAGCARKLRGSVPRWLRATWTTPAGILARGFCSSACKGAWAAQNAMTILGPAVAQAHADKLRDLHAQLAELGKAQAALILRREHLEIRNYG